MSALYVRPGGQITLDPNTSRIVVFDWDIDGNLATGVTISGSPVWTITAIKQIGNTALTKDNESVLSGTRKAQVRLIGTTATAGDRYDVSCKIVTSESPSQTKEYSIRVLIQDQ